MVPPFRWNKQIPFTFSVVQANQFRFTNGPTQVFGLKLYFWNVKQRSIIDWSTNWQIDILEHAPASTAPFFFVALLSKSSASFAGYIDVVHDVNKSALVLVEFSNNYSSPAFDVVPKSAKNTNHPAAFRSDVLMSKTQKSSPGQFSMGSWWLLWMFFSRCPSVQGSFRISLATIYLTTYVSEGAIDIFLNFLRPGCIKNNPMSPAVVWLKMLGWTSRDFGSTHDTSVGKIPSFSTNMVHFVGSGWVVFRFEHLEPSFAPHSDAASWTTSTVGFLLRCPGSGELGGASTVSSEWGSWRAGTAGGNFYTLDW